MSDVPVKGGVLDAFARRLLEKAAQCEREAEAVHDGDFADRLTAAMDRAAAVLLREIADAAAPAELRTEPEFELEDVLNDPEAVRDLRKAIRDGARDALAPLRHLEEELDLQTCPHGELPAGVSGCIDCLVEERERFRVALTKITSLSDPATDVHDIAASALKKGPWR